MTVRELSRVSRRFTGAAADDKPTNLPEGSTFYETDTDESYVYIGAAWVQEGALSGGSQTVTGTVAVSSIAAGSNRIGKTTVRNAANSADIDPLAVNSYVITMLGREQKTVQASAVGLSSIAASTKRATIYVGGTAGDAVRVGNATTAPTATSGLKIVVGDYLDLSDPVMDVSTLLPDLRFIRDTANVADITLDALYWS